jgi:pyruvate dehydrogenase E1 component beta subunit
MKTLVAAIADGLHHAMQADDKVVVMGEDVALNGGVFRATEGLFQTFGEHRVLDTPLSETGIVGCAIGMALYGLKPVVEIQFADYIFPAFDQITSELAKFRYRSGGDFSTPVVIRAPYGGGIRGGLYHSQSPEAYFTQTPGLVVVIPSTPYDAKGLLLSAIQSPDPVIFLEPKRIYRSIKEAIPDEPYTVPIGPSRLVRAGEHVSVFAYGAMIPVCEEAATLAAREGVTVDLIDLRTLYPVDASSILQSVQKTGRALIVYEAPKTGGYGAEIAALIAEQAIDYLKAPVMRLAGADTPFPYSVEGYYLPTPQRVYNGLMQVALYS